MCSSTQLQCRAHGEAPDADDGKTKLVNGLRSVHRAPALARPTRGPDAYKSPSPAPTMCCIQLTDTGLLILRTALVAPASLLSSPLNLAGCLLVLFLSSIMFFPVIKFSFQKERSRSQPPEIVPASWEAPLRPLSCQVAAPTRHSILLEDCVDDGLSEAPATLRRPSYVEPRAAPPLPPGSEVADITYIYPSRGRRGERTERRLSTQLPQPLESPEDSRYLSPRRAPIPRQELVLERPLPSGCRSCASGPSAARSTSSQRTRNAARSASIVFSSGSRRSGSSARSTTTTSSRRSASASAVSSVRTSPSLASSQTSRRSSVSTSPR